MEELNHEFLLTVAQISAVFMGFALLTPVFQAVVSGLKIPGEKYISNKIIFRKWLGLVCLPILVLFYSFLLSLLLVVFDRIIENPWYYISSIMFVFFFFMSLFKGQKMVGIKRKKRKT